MLTSAEQDADFAALLLPPIFRIFSLWQLTGAQQTTLLGLRDERTLCNWKGQPREAKLDREVIERASYILGIYKSLQILLPDPVLADRWLVTPNGNLLFNGEAPLDHLMTGNVLDIAAVRNHLDAECAYC
ncbi:MAG: MbcA/ParS/Xre antitoxin family protein [Gammaproteobacteria bacterium]|nr:MbcA/ParS/Xre antitoxin family protein [Gammaproteobacteria bacterium]